MLVDTPDQFAVYVRIHGLREIALVPSEGGTELRLRTTAGNVFRAILDQVNTTDGTATSINATLDRLPTDVELTLVEDELGRSITYAASNRMDRPRPTSCSVGPTARRRSSSRCSTSRPG